MLVYPLKLNVAIASLQRAVASADRAPTDQTHAVFEERSAELDAELRKLAEVWKGWVNNYRLASINAKLKTVDEWLRNRLRYCIWHDWKKPERKRKNLIRMGIKQGQAYAWSRTRMGGWAVAQSPILGTTITLSRLRRKGYEAMLLYYHKTQPQIQ